MGVSQLLNKISFKKSNSIYVRSGCRMNKLTSNILEQCQGHALIRRGLICTTASLCRRVLMARKFLFDKAGIHKRQNYALCNSILLKLETT